jgi:methionine sulfoxide reductase catalytic subunit
VSPSTLDGARTLEKVTPYADATTYNNFYEFGTDKADPARKAGALKTRPWTVQVEGWCKKPQTFGIEDLLKLAPLEERIYRLRCVEGWSMVIPWIGYSLSALLKQVQPLGSAKFVEFHTLADRETMPGLRSSVLRLALCRGAAAGRGHAPADAADLRHVRRGAAEPERRAGAVGGALEVRLQERQVHRENPPGRAAAGHRLERGRAAGIRLLFQRQPECGRTRAGARPCERRIGEGGLFAKRHKTLVQRLRSRRWGSCTPAWTAVIV